MKLHILFLALTLGAAASASAQSNWPQWRGPNRDGQFTGPTWPERLDTNHLQRTLNDAEALAFFSVLNEWEGSRKKMR